MSTLVEAVDVIKQAKELGYLLVCSPPPRGPWYITPGGRSYAPFGPFPTKEDAESALPEILRDDAQARRLKTGYHLGRGVDKQWYVDIPKGNPLGPFESSGEALDAAEQSIRENARTDAEYLHRLTQQRLERSRIPVAFQGITLDKFDAKTGTLKQAVETAREYVRRFPTWREGMLLCGAVDRGKTTLGCAIASALAVAGHDVCYTTVVEIIVEQLAGIRQDGQSRLSAPDLLVLDWIGIGPSTRSKAAGNMAEVVGALSSRAVANALGAREAAGRPTLLIADCEIAQLRCYLGETLSQKLLFKSFWQRLEF